MIRPLLRAAMLVGPVAALLPALAWGGEPLLQDPTQLTFPSQFSRAGEAYFSPDGDWIIFQAVATDEDNEAGDAPYAMFVAPLERDRDDHVTGLGEAVRISPIGSANSCGWFHPALPGVVLFGSTLVVPTQQEEPGYSRESSRYSWAFPGQMDIVTRTVPEIVEALVEGDLLRAELLARNDVTAPSPLWKRDGYDAEGSWSPDGRFILFTAVDTQTGDADIFVRDQASGRTIPLVVEPGYDGGPFFSPDGRRICYRSDRDENDLLQVFVADLAFDRRGVPTGLAREVQLTKNEHVNWAPFWHPSGDYLIYATSQVSHRNYEVFAIASRLTSLGDRPSPVRMTNAEGFDGLPVFSPDGSLMMWTGQRGELEESGKRTSQIWVAQIPDVPPADLGISHGASGELQASDQPVADSQARVSDDARDFGTHVTVLASNWLAGRLPGTPGIELAERYIADAFMAYGLEPGFPATPEADGASAATMFQSFDMNPHGTNKTISARNVAAMLPGRGALADRYIVIGAHHDHLGYGEFSSMEGEGEIHNGADDNASGVSALLLMAKQLAEQYDALPDDTDLRSMLFVTFSAEEMGLNGSRHFVQHPPFELDACDLMLNIDMIGRITNGRVEVSGLGTGKGLSDLVDGPLSAGPLEVVRPDGLSSRSDHAAFYDESVPVMFFTITPFHLDYHKPSDDSWKINSHGGALAAALTSDVALKVARFDGSIQFTEIENYDRGPSATMGKVKIRFGIMPGNYNDAEPGVLVQRVSPDSSAEHGGVLADDRLMRWNGQLIESIPLWMELMAEHEPGDVVRVEVLREGEPVELDIELFGREPQPEPDE